MKTEQAELGFISALVSAVFSFLAAVPPMIATTVAAVAPVAVAAISAGGLMNSLFTPTSNANSYMGYNTEAIEILAAKQTEIAGFLQQELTTQKKVLEEVQQKQLAEEVGEEEKAKLQKYLLYAALGGLGIILVVKIAKK